MKYKLTPKVIDRYIVRAANNFYDSNAPNSQKKQLERLIPNLDWQYCSSLKTSWGQAYMLHPYDALSGRTETKRKPIKIQCLGDKYHILLQLNERVLQWARPQEVFDTVAHELGHCLDFCLRGTTFHDKYWKTLTQSMGGTGETTAHTDVPDYVFTEDIFNKPELRKGYHDVY